MKQQLLKIFYTALVLTIGAGLETYIIGFINKHDDVISTIAFISSFGIVLIMIYVIYKIWLKINPKTNETNS